MIFLLSSKWVLKQQSQLATSTMHLAQKLLKNIQCSDKKFAKEIRVLKMRSAVVTHWMLTMTNGEQSSKLILLQLQEKLLKNSTMIILWSSSIWCFNLERWKSSISGCLMKVKMKPLSRIGLFTIPWTVVYQVSPSMEFSRQEYWSGLPFPSPDRVERVHNPMPPNLCLSCNLRM